METPNLPQRAPLSPKWQFRFDFFDRYGAPSTPEYKAAFKALPFMDRLKINMNFFALFFGFIYFFILGMWRKALGLIGISLAVGIVAAFLPDAIGRGLGIAYSLLVGMAANYAYYLDQRKGSVSWNPFEGVRWW